MLKVIVEATPAHDLGEGLLKSFDCSTGNVGVGLNFLCEDDIHSTLPIQCR
jgi:hypothetical protein